MVRRHAAVERRATGRVASGGLRDVPGDARRVVRTEPPPAPSGLGSVLSGFSSVVSGFSRTRRNAAQAFRETRWRWAVPLAAAATVAAIFVAVPQEERTAQLNPTAAPPPISERAVPPAEAVSADAAAPAQATQRPARGDAPASSLADQAAPEARAKTANQEKADQFASSRSLETKERDQDLKAEAATPPAAAAAGAQAARAPGLPERLNGVPPAAPPPAQEQNRARAEGDAASLLRQAAPAEIVSPDPQVRWRIVPPGRLERSTNAGQTWEVVTFLQSVTVTAVRAPSATTAIVTAADGRQLRTDDQGKTWNLFQP